MAFRFKGLRDCAKDGRHQNCIDKLSGEIALLLEAARGHALVLFNACAAAILDERFVPGHPVTLAFAGKPDPTAAKCVRDCPYIRRRAEECEAS